MSTNIKDIAEKIKFDREALTSYSEGSLKKVEGYWVITEEESKRAGAFPWPIAHESKFYGKAACVATIIFAFRGQQ